MSKKKVKVVNKVINDVVDDVLHDTIDSLVKDITFLIADIQEMEKEISKYKFRLRRGLLALSFTQLEVL